MLTYNTSLRVRPIEETLEYAKSYALKYGITRVTDTTCLDTIGVPVFASIRPGAMKGSLCVSAGKGMTKNEAKIGAYMEALELALAEPNVAGLEIIQTTVEQVLDGTERDEAILDFCPKLGTEIALDQPIKCTKAIDLFTGKDFLVPAELVFIPYRVAFPEDTLLFGAHSNGLCSGNSLTEASIHGIFEVIERDIVSFQKIRNTSLRIVPESYPAPVIAMQEKIANAGFELILQYVQNHFNIPFFQAYLIDPTAETPVYVNSGYGCHIDKSIAAMRAISEAIQSRLSIIHGGRDDLTEIYEPYKNLSTEEVKQLYYQQVNHIRQEKAILRYDAIDQPQWEYGSIEECLQLLLGLLREKGITYVLRTAFTQPDEPLQVVKIIIPKLEFFNSSNPRIGPRMMQFTNHYADDIIRRAQPD